MKNECEILEEMTGRTLTKKARAFIAQAVEHSRRERQAGGVGPFHFDAGADVFQEFFTTDRKAVETIELRVPVQGGEIRISSHPVQRGEWRVSCYPADADPMPHTTMFFKSAKAAALWADEYEASHHSGEVVKRWSIQKPGAKLEKKHPRFGVICTIHPQAGRFRVDVWHPSEWARISTSNATFSEVAAAYHGKVTGEIFRRRGGGKTTGAGQTEAMTERVNAFRPFLEEVVAEFPKGKPGAAGMCKKSFWDRTAAQRFNTYNIFNKTGVERIEMRTATKYRLLIESSTPKNTRTRS